MGAASSVQPSKLRQRIALWALQQAQRSVWALVLLGFTALVLLPLAAQKCYLDEKALLVGGAVSTVRCVHLPPPPLPPPAT